MSAKLSPRTDIQDAVQLADLRPEAGGRQKRAAVQAKYADVVALDVVLGHIAGKMQEGEFRRQPRSLGREAGRDETADGQRADAQIAGACRMPEQTDRDFSAATHSTSPGLGWFRRQGSRNTKTSVRNGRIRSGVD